MNDHYKMLGAACAFTWFLFRLQGMNSAEKMALGRKVFALPKPKK